MEAIFYCLAFSVMAVPASAECHSCLDHICYTRQKLFETAQLSGQLAIDRATNKLHFHYQDYRSDDYTAILNLNSLRTDVTFLPIGYSFARAMDRATGSVYMSSLQGVYVYNSVTKRTNLYGFPDKTIWHMQFKDKLYYSEYQSPGLYYVENNRSVFIPPLSEYIIDDFIVDKFDDIYFTSEYIVYRLRNNANNATLFSTIIYSLTTDKDDNAYFIETGPRTLFKMDYKRDILKEVGLLGSGNVFRAVFDATNNLIYSDAMDDKIYYLYPNFVRCTITTKGTTARPGPYSKVNHRPT